MRDFKVIGLTGPTGSGKSTFSKLLQERGCVIIDADQLARQATAPHSVCVLQLASAFGADIKTPDGGINRGLLAKRAFASKENTKLLNDLVHPWVFLKTLELINGYRKQGKKQIVFDAPVLFESNADAMCDTVISVVAPKAVRMQRIIDRDGLTRQQALQRISAQQTDEYYCRRSDLVIDGAKGTEYLKQQAAQVTESLREK